MRLRRVEAVRYGGLADFSLGDLGNGLTVVHGPNEAGKSSLTSLVRHVLYGFPRRGGTERAYDVPGANRCGRLVFEDETGAWMIERNEGVHGGPVTIHTIAGPERPALLDELTKGVTDRTYRTVFGFGLAEMDAIERERSSEDGVVARLYAAGAGLRVSPQEVRGTIDKEAGELFKPGGRKQPVIEMATELRRVRGELRDLRVEGEAFLGDQARLSQMDHDLEASRQLRDAAQERATEVAVALERAEERRVSLAAVEEMLPELLRAKRQFEAEKAGLTVNDALLQAAPEMEALLDDAAGHSRALQALAESSAAVVRAETRESDAAARTGLGPEALEALGSSQDAAAIIDQAREDLQRLQMQCETRDESVQRAQAELERARVERDRLLAPLGITGEPSEAIAERLAAADALEALRAGGAARRRSGIDIPSLILLVSGIIAVAAGVLRAEWLTALIGVLLAAAGIVFLLRSGKGGSALPQGDEWSYLRLLGLESSAGPLEVSRVRRALEAARAAEALVGAASRASEEARTEAGLGCEALEARRMLWAEWLGQHGLDPALTPAAAAHVLGLVRDVRTQHALAEEARQAHAHAREQLDAFAARFAQMAGAFIGLQEAPAAEEVPALANRLKESLAWARIAAARREEIAREITSLDSRIGAETDRGARAREELLEVLERFDLAEGGSVEDLRVLQSTARRLAAEATVAFDELAKARNQLEERLASGARNRRTGELHVEEAALAERLGEAVDRYLVLSVASRLLSEAQSRYQRERQPEVVKRAATFFSTMTGGRYAGLTFPLDGGSIEVLDTRSGVRTSDILSGGAADQLYLAVRLGLISQLTDVGHRLPVLMDDVLVNFDPGRERGAAEAIAELAETRQVLFFTCHPHTADLLGSVAPDHVRIDLPRLAI